MTMPHMAKKLRVVPYILWSLLSSTSPFSSVSSPFPCLSNLVRSPLFLNHRLVIFLILPRHLFPPYAPDYKQISLSGSSLFYVFTSDGGTETTPLHSSGLGSAPLRLLSWCEVYQWLIFKKKLRNISLQSVTIIQSTVVGFKPTTLQLITDISTKVHSPLPKPSMLPSLSFF